MLIPSLRGSREVAKQAICMSNMKQIGKCSFQYSTDNGTYIVPGTMHHSNISDYPNTANGSASARYSDYFLLGKYGINPKPEGSVWTGIEGWTPDKNTAVRCPSALDEDHQAPNRYQVRIGMNLLAFKGVGDDKDHSKLITQQEVLNPGKLAAWVDSRIARFNPGWNQQTHGNEQPTSSNDLNWGIGTTNSFYNWVKRHRKGTNVGFIDGHVSYSKNLQSAVASDKIFVKNE